MMRWPQSAKIGLGSDLASSFWDEPDGLASIIAFGYSKAYVRASRFIRCRADILQAIWIKLMAYSRSRIRHDQRPAETNIMTRSEMSSHEQQESQQAASAIAPANYPILMGWLKDTSAPVQARER
jgi:hypothetical protein